MKYLTRNRTRKALKRKKKNDSLIGEKKKKNIPLTNINQYSDLIIRSMNEGDIKGNYKDYVLFIGDKLIDRYGSYTVIRPDVTLENDCMLLHKSKIRLIANEKWGENFWNHSCNKRTNFGIENLHTIVNT